MQTIILKESRSPYTIGDEVFVKEPVLLERDGQMIAALVPLEEYRAFVAWRKKHTKADVNLERDRATFARLKPELLKTHLGEYAVIKDGELVAVGKDQQTLIDQTYQRFGVVDLYVKHIETQERIYRIPGPRKAKKQ
jgi:hypothetical protein